MVHLIVELSKYALIILFSVYTYECFAVFRNISERKQEKKFKRQARILYAIHFTAYLVIFAVTEDTYTFIFYLAQIILLVVVRNVYKLCYPMASRLLVNNMCMLMIIGFIILTRLNFGHAIKQFAIAAVSCVISLVIPVMIRRMGFFRNLTWIYAAIGIVGLGIVCIAGSTSYGAKISFTIAGITVQPSEFIKILFVFFVAAMYHKSTEFRQVVITTLIAALHVLILVLSRDLGGALIFFVAYMAMLYVATRKPLYFAGGLLALFTPCVWPIIPMTVSFFLKRSKDKKKGIRDAWTYGASIVVIYVTLGLAITLVFGASALNALSTNAVFNILFCLMLVVFAASFFGAFEITLPSKWSTAVDSKAEATSGLLSIFLMAFTLSLVSFSCTGPIIGFLLVQVSTTGSVVAPAIGMLGFAIALALPFTLFALFPSWLKSMPKSGGWMNIIKVTLGFLELAFALKFLSVCLLYTSPSPRDCS